MKMPRTNLPNLASRLFNTPLMIEQVKLDTIVGVFMDKLSGIEMAVQEKHGTNRGAKYPIERSIAMIPVMGSLVNRGMTMGPESGMTSYEFIGEALDHAMQNPDVDQILFDIDSPGGEADGAFDLSDKIFGYRGEKPMTAIANGMAASAAYAIASAADKVYITRTGVTGSVGVLAVHKDISGKNEKEGVNVSIIRAGDKKAAMNPFEPLTDAVRTKIQAEVDSLYEEFTALVARNRGISVEQVKATEADTFSGKSALNVGFVDGVVTVDELNRSLLETEGVASVTNVVLTSTKKETEMSNNKEAPVQADASVEDLNSARTNGYTAAAEIVQLCTIAGCPEKATGFLERAATADQVRTELLTAQAVTDKAAELETAIPETALTMNDNVNRHVRLHFA